MLKLFEIPSITLFLCVFCTFLWLKNPRNQRNLRLINDLRSTKVYVRKNKLFLQNEPNFRKSQVNVSDVLTRIYVQMDTWLIRKNEPKTNPIRTQTNPIKAKTKPIRTQNEANFLASQTIEFAQFNINVLRTMNNELKKRTQFPRAFC